MKEIKISECMYSEDPNQPAIRLSNLDMFLDGLKKLCEATNMHSIKYVNIGEVTVPLRFSFDDGTYIGIKTLLKELGFKID